MECRRLALQRFYGEHPISKIMLAMAKDNMALLKKVGIKESHVNIKSLCRSFFRKQTPAAYSQQFSKRECKDG